MQKGWNDKLRGLFRDLTRPDIQKIKFTPAKTFISQITFPSKIRKTIFSYRNTS